MASAQKPDAWWEENPPYMEGQSIMVMLLCTRRTQPEVRRGIKAPALALSGLCVTLLNSPSSAVKPCGCRASAWKVILGNLLYRIPIVAARKHMCGNKFLLKQCIKKISCKMCNKVLNTVQRWLGIGTGYNSENLKTCVYCTLFARRRKDILTKVKHLFKKFTYFYMKASMSFILHIFVI